MTDGNSPDPWGPFRSLIAEALDSCGDYLGRLFRSFSGEIANDRHYFTEKAVQLRDASCRLLERCDDVELWLRQCGAQVHQTYADKAGEEHRYETECDLRAGHEGPHRSDEPSPSPARRLAEEARLLVATALRSGDHLARLALDLQDRVEPDYLPSGETSRTLAELGLLATSLTTALSELARQTPRGER